jgi:hypothetical protein
VTGDSQPQVSLPFRRNGFVRSNKRYLTAILLSVVLTGRAAVSLVFFASGGNGYTNPNAIPALIAVSALGALVAFGSLILSASSRWQTTGPARWQALKILWVLCAALLAIEWIVALGSSG